MMTEEEWFRILGSQFAVELARKHDSKVTPELEKFCADFKYRWFCAECSDDYSRTLSEQLDLRKELKEFIDGLKARSA